MSTQQKGRRTSTKGRRINSTAWRDPMAQESGCNAMLISEKAEPISDEEILEHLETSLRASQRALLVRDLAELERLTVEQVALRQALAKTVARRSPGSDSLATHLSDQARRVLQLGRVQVVLLGRAQQSLRAIANLLAGTHAGYTSVGRVGADCSAGISGTR